MHKISRFDFEKEKKSILKKKQTTYVETYVRK